MGTLKKEGADGLMLKGFVDIELVNTKDNTRRVLHNTITKAGKQLILDKAVGGLLKTSDIHGLSFCSQLMAKNSYYSNVASYNNGSAYHNRSDVCLNNVLLSLDDSQLANLSTDTTFIDVKGDNLKIADKVLGYGSNNKIPLNNGKEAMNDFCKDEYMVIDNAIVNRWKYPEGVATGTINAIAMMPGMAVRDGFNGDGIKFSRCIDKGNFDYNNFASASTGFLIPGVPGYTANDEIMLNCNIDGVSRWKYNITTGAMTEVPSSDPFFVSEKLNSRNVCDIQVFGQYLYVLYQGAYYEYELSLYVYDINNGMNRVAALSMSKGAYSRYNKLLKVGDDIYITIAKCIKDASITDNAMEAHKLTIGTNGYPTSYKTLDDISSVYSKPNGIDFCCIGNYGDKYIMYCPMFVSKNLATTLTEDTDTVMKYTCGYVFNSLDDIRGTITDMIPLVTRSEVAFSAGANSGTIKLGYDASVYNNSMADTYKHIDRSDGKVIAMTNSNNKNDALTYDLYNTGVFLTLNGWWSNVFSIVKLDTPIEKSDTDILYVTYGYKIV